MGLPEKIKKLRMNNKISQKRLADAIGVAQSSINYWEKGQRIPSIAAAQKLADFFNITLDQLYEDNKTPLYDASSHTTEYVSETIAPYGSDNAKGAMDAHKTDLSRKDERDIEKILNTAREQLLSQEGLMFDCDPASPEAVDSILAAMQIGMEMAKKRNKEKYGFKNNPKDSDN